MARRRARAAGASKASSSSSMCMGGVCAKCHGWKLLVVGLLILANNLWWPQYNDWAFLGGLLAVGGLLKLAKPSCGHCA